LKTKAFGNPDPSEIIVIDDDQETPIKNNTEQSKTNDNVLWADWNLLDHISDEESIPEVTDPNFNEFWENQPIGDFKAQTSITSSTRLQLFPNQSSKNQLENKETLTATSMYIQVNCANF